MKKPMLAALALSSVVLLAGCNSTPVENEVVENNEPEVEITVDEEPEVEVVEIDEGATGEVVLSGAQEVEVPEAPEVEETVEEATEEAAE